MPVEWLVVVLGLRRRRWGVGADAYAACASNSSGHSSRRWRRYAAAPGPDAGGIRLAAPRCSAAAACCDTRPRDHACAVAAPLPCLRTMPPPPALTSHRRRAACARAADASSDRKRPRAVTPRDRFVGSRLDDADAAYRARRAGARSEERPARSNASLRNALRRGGGDRDSCPSAPTARPGPTRQRARGADVAVRAAASATAARWRDLKFERCVDAPDVRDDATRSSLTGRRTAIS